MIPTLTLNDGSRIPQLGFGTFLVPPDETERIVSEALAVGYRHIDTAQAYRNERGVGAAVTASGIARDDLYLTSKVWNSRHKRDDVLRSFDVTLSKLGVDRLDLFLIHWPVPTLYDGDFVTTWKAMLELVDQGALTSAGVSNFEPAHLDRIVAETGRAPVVNQIEAHPYFPNAVARAASHGHGTVVEAWGPLGQGSILGDPAIAVVAEEVGRTSAQAILRWHIQRGDIIFPKSMRRDRMQENFEIFDFKLSPEQLAAIDALDQGPDGRVGPDPNTFAVA